MVRLKSSEGYSLDFQIFNLFGFAYYTISNIHYLQINKADYRSIMDLIFSTHALLISIVIFGLTFHYPRKQNKFNVGPYIMILILVLSSIAYYFINDKYYHGQTSDLWIFMGMGKSIVSTFKYLY